MTTRIEQAISAMLPVPEQTLLLRAALLTGGPCRDAWNEWTRLVGNPKQAMSDDRGSVKRLLPALYVSLRDNGADVDAALWPYLKLAYVREQMRSRTYYRICGEILQALNAAAIPVVMLRGGALAATVYPDAALRHCHDIALLVQDEHCSRACEVILQSGRTIVPWNADDGGPAAILRDETSLPIEVHTRLLNVPYYALLWNSVFPRTRAAAIGGRNARVLSPEDALVHVCAHASYSAARESMRWITDAWHLIRNRTIRWKVVMDIAIGSNVALPVGVALRYLAHALDADVPATTLLQFERAALTAAPAARDIALRGVRSGDGASLSGLFARMPAGWNLRAGVVFWLLFPSRAYVRDVVGAKGALSVAAHYARRPMGYARQLVARR